MTHEEAFLQAILEQPDDDAPRLVYADWLEEHGESERAAFIRLHIELAGMDPDDSRRDEVRRKLGPMLHGQQVAWRARLGRGVDGLRLARGFAEGVRLTATHWLRRGRRLLEAAPIREVQLSEAGPQVEALAAAATLARLTALDLSHNELGAGAAR